MLGFIVLPLGARFTSYLGTLVGYSRPSRVLFNDIDMVSRFASSVECCVSDGGEGAARVVTVPSGISIPPRLATFVGLLAGVTCVTGVSPCSLRTLLA